MPATFEPNKTVLYLLAADRELPPGIRASRAPNPFSLQITEARVQGTVALTEPASLGDHTYQFQIQVDTEIENPVVEPRPAAAKAFLAYVAALRRGDKEGILRAVDPEKAEMARQSPEWPETLKMIQSMEPTGIIVQKTWTVNRNSER